MTDKSIISQLLSTNVPDILYHYTDSSGMIGIITSNKIWTTKIHYLNDKSESQLAFDYIRYEIDQQRKGIGRTQTNEELENKDEALNSIGTVNVSVASFTEIGDQLSQWRGYSNIGNGYSLGFDGQRLLKEVITHEGYHLVPCVYEEQKHKLIVKELVDSTSVINVPQNPNFGKPPFLKMSFSEAVLFIAPMIKSEGFQEEKEWRLISPPMGFDIADYRHGDQSLIPYWTFDVNVTETLVSIIIGPTSESVLSYEALKGFLIKSGRFVASVNETYYLNPIFDNIKHSKIPYRKI